ncbi:Uncharacterised protein [Vibrio cholerae]|nr:Uncharacterised protein [Vibrio cholerae]
MNESFRDRITEPVSGIHILQIDKRGHRNWRTSSNAGIREHQIFRHALNKEIQCVTRTLHQHKL